VTLVVGDIDVTRLAGDLVRSEGVHGGVEGRRNSKLGERLTGDVDLVSIKLGWFDDRVEDGECTFRATHTASTG
jgi:hypothetical protein